MGYLHLIIDNINEGAKGRRLSWPKGQYLTKSPDLLLTLSKEEADQVGISENAEVTIPNPFVLVESDDKAIVGYVLTHEDKTHQDWELVK